MSKAILILPKWATQPWYPRLLNMLIGIPVRLPMIPNLLRLVHNNQLHPLNKRKMFLFACIVSGKKLRSTVFQRNLSDSIQIHEDPVPIRTTTLYEQSGSKTCPKQVSKGFKYIKLTTYWTQKSGLTLTFEHVS